ncbi:DUF4259 domain-containing protein [Streptomyces sp. CAU 1734]|uniref:DUF4259 domain-containing protein n=1 Tax=Streptomyces sp. CAU 1734 TaxID=3140360 RepID=UPI0032601A6E
MGTWDTGHFDSDAAADFGWRLDQIAAEEREEFLRGFLTGEVGAGDFLDGSTGAQAVAAAALIAAQCPGGEPVTTAYGPKTPQPEFSPALRTTAVRALDRVLGKDSELAELWDETEDAAQWRGGVEHLREVLSAAAP